MTNDRQQENCLACPYKPGSPEYCKAENGDGPCLSGTIMQGEDAPGEVLDPMPFSEIVGRWCKQIQDKRGM